MGAVTLSPIAFSISINYNLIVTIVEKFQERSIELIGALILRPMAGLVDQHNLDLALSDELCLPPAKDRLAYGSSRKTVSVLGSSESRRSSYKLPGHDFAEHVVVGPVCCKFSGGYRPTHWGGSSGRETAISCVCGWFLWSGVPVASRVRSCRRFCPGM